ncbi:MAG: ribulose-1,5-biphosphate synthetase [candidate division Zixibacteria bacterium SM23_73_3]|nr:MAG: ribulose-1,5-biphosphate synthetase [candidate division Zixibacteria bacterium SM23_73_3]
MKLDDVVITRAIVESFYKKLLEYSDVDVAIAGAGPAGLCAAYYLAREKVRVAVFERKLSIGGGMWGGGMMFNELVVGEEGKGILDEIEVNYKIYQKGYYTADAVECISTLCSKATKAGAKVFNLISVEDVMLVGEEVCGLVLNWSAVQMANLHVDPLTIRAKYLVEATGHPAELVKIIVKKIGPRLLTSTGDIVGEKPMWADMGEKEVVENSKEAYPNVYVAGMAANAVFGAHRMGPIFGGMLLSGKKVSNEVLKKLKTQK